MANELFYIDRLQAVYSLQKNLNIIDLTTGRLHDMIWNTRKTCFFDCSNRQMDIIGTYLAQFGEGHPAQDVPDCLLYLEDSQLDSRIALFSMHDVLSAALTLQPWYDFEDGVDEECDRFINDLRARLIDIKAPEFREDYDLYMLAAA